MYCYIRLAWLSRTSIAVTSGRINQNSLGSILLKFVIPNQSELAESPRPMSDTKNLMSPFVLSQLKNLVSYPFGFKTRVLRRLFGLNLYTLLLFKACLSANFSCVRYWPYSKGVRAIYIFRTIQERH